MNRRQWRKCGAPGCQRRVTTYYFCCGQHRALLGFVLNADLQSAWIHRATWPDQFKELKAKAFRAWGYEVETMCPKN